MKYSLIARVIAMLACTISVVLLIPALVALLYGEQRELFVFLQVSAPTGIAGVLLFLLTTRGRQEQFSLTSHDGLLVVVLSWLTMAGVGAVPFVLSGAIPNYGNALFETMSGFTTTGASILTEIEVLPRSMLFWRSFTHWLGGMGIIVLAVAIFPLLGFKGYQLMRAEAPGPSVDKLTPKIAHTAKILWLLYIGLSAAEAILLKWAGMDVFDAVTHTFGTVATGGFSPHNASIAAFDSASIDAIITVFMLLSGVNFVMYYSLIARRFSTVRRNSELKVYIGIVVSAILMTTLLLARTQYDTIAESLRFASFQVASILTTTGYVTADYQLWPTAAMAVLFILMFIGGSAGSTAGGVKVVRHTALLKQAFNEMKYLLHPRGVFSPRLNDQPLRKSMVLGVAGFVFLYLLLLLITTLVVTLSGASILTGFSAALATLGCIGPGFGGVGPVENYAAFPMGVKLFLTFIMLVGRLEVYTVLILFTPGYWRR